MPGQIDERVLRPASGQAIALTQGLHLVGGGGGAPAGSLREAYNVEFVNGRLESSKVAWALGAGQLNKAPTDTYYLHGVLNTDWTITGSITNNTWYPVNFYADTLTPTVIGTGYIKYIPTAKGGFQNLYVIVGVSGQGPQDATYFKIVETATWSLVLTGTARFYRPDGYHKGPVAGFTTLDAEYASRHGGSVRSALSSNTWDAFRPAPPTNGGTSHVFQVGNYAYAVVDFVVGEFIDGTTEIPIGTHIEVVGASDTPSFYVARQELRSGTYEDGDAYGLLYLYPQSDSTLDDSLYDVFEESQKTIRAFGGGATYCTTAPNTSPAVRPHQSSHGLLWRLDISSVLNTGWEYVDIGSSIRFNGGLIAPLSEEAPVFVTDSIPSLQETTLTVTGSVAQHGGAGLDSWVNGAPYDITFSNGTSKFLELTVPGTIPADATITGLTVNITAKQTAGSAGDVYFKKVQLFNNLADDVGDTVLLDEFESVNMAGDQSTWGLTTSPVVYSFGGQLDMLGLDRLVPSDINTNDMSLGIQMEDSTASRTVNITGIEVIVHYSLQEQTVYLYNGTSDYGSAKLYSYQVLDGDWSTNDAQGWMTIHEESFTSWPAAGAEIRTGSGGTGDLIGYVDYVQRNLLPSLAELRARGTRSQVYVGNIGRSIDNTKAFVVNGESPCFSVAVDGRFQFIRTAAAPDKDRPRFVSEIANHLVLGLEEHLMVSSIATANNFSTYDGATSWALGDTISGIVRQADNSLIIGTSNTLQILSGSAASGSDGFQLRHHSSSTGCRPYSMVLAGDVYMVDDSGVTSLSVTDKYGDFIQGFLSADIEPYLRPRLEERVSAGDFSSKGFLEAFKVRDRDQLRWTFNDGQTLVGEISGEGGPIKYTVQWPALAYYYTVDEGYIRTDTTLAESTQYTCIFSGVSSWGEEVLLAGTEGGLILRLDAHHNGLSPWGNYSPCTFALNPMNVSGDGETEVRVTGSSLMYEVASGVRLSMYQGVDFSMPPLPLADEASTSTSGHLLGDHSEDTDEFLGDMETKVARFYQNDITNGPSWRVFSADNTSWFAPIRYLTISPYFEQLKRGTSRAQSGVSVGSTSRALTK